MANVKKIHIPDIGGAVDVDVIEVFVSPGDKVEQEDSLITLEGEKATMEVPAPEAGVIETVDIKVGDKVSEGSLIVTMRVEGAADEVPDAVTSEASPVLEETPPKPESSSKSESTPPDLTFEPPAVGANVHAGPGVRRLAHELEIDLHQVSGTGAKGRILKQDLLQYVKGQLKQPSSVGGGLSVPPAPAVDFSQFGPTETVTLNKIKKLTGVNVHRSWVTVPHVTQFGEADITDLEAFRKSHKKEVEDRGARLTPLVFIMQAVVDSLKQFPQFNASLDPNGEQLILKKYFNLGIAVDTPNGLVVPVIRDVDKKGMFELAKELGDISAKAREKGLSMKEMSGSCFTISSLGGIGGTAFTPIINTPDVAILGISRSTIKPVYQKGAFVPRLMLPLSLSYDHRVIDGADGARFIEHVSSRLSDICTLLL